MPPFNRISSMLVKQDAVHGVLVIESCPSLTNPTDHQKKKPLNMSSAACSQRLWAMQREEEEEQQRENRSKYRAVKKTVDQSVIDRSLDEATSPFHHSVDPQDDSHLFTGDRCLKPLDINLHESAWTAMSLALLSVVCILYYFSYWFLFTHNTILCFCRFF